MAVKAINNETHFQAVAGGELVVMGFIATWCDPCRNIEPLLEKLQTKYPKAIFLKVDVDECAETASSQRMSAMPTFIFFRARTKIDLIQDTDINGLEQKIQRHHVTSADEPYHGLLN